MENKLLAVVIVQVVLAACMVSADNASNDVHNLAFFELRREVDCSISRNWTAFLEHENMQLKSHQHISSGHHVCPNNSLSFGTKASQTSVCPWSYHIIDLGETFYPRYIKEAVCLCERCISDNARSCQFLRAHASVLERSHCMGGRATVKMVRRSIKVGCYCQNNVVQPMDNNPGLVPADVEVLVHPAPKCQYDMV